MPHSKIIPDCRAATLKDLHDLQLRAGAYAVVQPTAASCLSNLGSRASPKLWERKVSELSKIKVVGTVMICQRVARSSRSVASTLITCSLSPNFASRVCKVGSCTVLHTTQVGDVKYKIRNLPGVRPATSSGIRRPRHN